MKKELSGCLLLSFLLFGCQSYQLRSHEQDTSHSYAWNLNNTSSMNLFYDNNVTPELKKEFESKNYYWGTTTDHNPLNLSNMNLYPIMLHYYYIRMGGEHWTTNQILGWVSQSIATSDQQAGLVVEQELNKAIKKTWPDMQFNQLTEYEGSLSKLLPYGVAGYPTRFSSTYFWDTDVNCKTNRFKKQYKPDSCFFFLSNDGIASLIKTPFFIHPKPSEYSYVTKPLYVSMDVKDGLGTGYDEARNERALFQKLSNNLPSWIVIYLAQDEKNYLPAVMLQNGKSYFYIN